MTQEKNPRESGLVLMLLVIGLSLTSIYSLAASHLARATLFFIPISLALLQMLLHHLARQPGWTDRLGVVADCICIAAVIGFIMIGTATLAPIIRNATQARIEHLLNA